MDYIKLQLGCLAVLLYIAFIYLRECKKYHQKLENTLFDELLILGISSVTLDGITAFTVNHLEYVPVMLNHVLHALFLISLDAVIFVLCLYMLYLTGVYPKKLAWKLLLFVPFIINISVVVFHIHSLEYIIGNRTNYSMGISAYTCYIMAVLYILMALIAFLKRWDYIESEKRANILIYMLVLILVTGTQMLFPEALISSIAVTVFVLGVYMNQEDPSLKELSRYHDETVMAFANIIENRDNNTGGHIKRTSMYVQLIAEELRKRGQYKELLTEDYIKNLKKAAPMHDIGKVSVPDAILQKPGKLTDEEFVTMKLHAENGGKMIQETFKHLGSDEYRHMAYEVARYHHEKWNGRGYPEGLKEYEIPLCARIMAVADVFDAVSEKRCYRDAMPLDKCFSIIEQGSGQDFDPVIAEVFLAVRDKVEKVHSEMNHE